jgi:thymidylate kinase
MRLEELLYEPMTEPDLLFVLQVPAEVSRQRKPEEDPSKVEERAREILEVDWRATGAVVLDASRPAEEVAGELKRRLWQRL